jgi:hypothetical protein
MEDGASDGSSDGFFAERQVTAGSNGWMNAKATDVESRFRADAEMENQSKID